MGNKVKIPKLQNNDPFSTAVPGPWWILYEDSRGNAVLLMRCPSGHVRTMDHNVSSDGIVSPSILCGHGCSWHVFAKLLDWNLGEWNK